MLIFAKIHKKTNVACVNSWNKIFWYEIIGNLTILEKAGASLTAGFVGAMVGNPADLALVRFQSDTLLPPDQRRNYKNVFDALSRIVSEEGVLALWKGCSPTVYRALIINLGMLSTFDEVKERLNAYTNTVDTLQTRVM